MKDYRAVKCNKCGFTPSAHGVEFRRTKRFLEMVSHPFVFVFDSK